MKKLLAIILAFAMLLSMAVVVSAEEEVVLGDKTFVENNIYTMTADRDGKDLASITVENWGWVNVVGTGNTPDVYKVASALNSGAYLKLTYVGNDAPRVFIQGTGSLAQIGGNNKIDKYADYNIPGDNGYMVAYYSGTDIMNNYYTVSGATSPNDWNVWNLVVTLALNSTLYEASVVNLAEVPEGYDAVWSLSGSLPKIDGSWATVIKAENGYDFTGLYDSLALDNSVLYIQTNLMSYGTNWAKIGSATEGTYGSDGATAELTEQGYLFKIDGETFLKRIVNGVIKEVYLEHADTSARGGITAVYVATANPVATDSKGNTYYDDVTLQDVINAVSVTGGTVILQSDIEADLVLNHAGVTLDLNGHTLTADNFVSFNGANVVDKGATKGLLNVARNNVSIGNFANAHMPIWNGNGYVFAAVGHQTVGTVTAGETTDSAHIVFRPWLTANDADGELDNYASLFATADSVNDSLKVELLVSWVEADGITGNQNFVYSADFVKDVYANGKAFSIDLSGLEKDVEYTFTVKLSSDMKIENTAIVNLAQ